MTRKEFFTFLWELKQTAKQTLNEGQMMSCWVQVSKKKDSIDFEGFKELEFYILYFIFLFCISLFFFLLLGSFN